MDNLVGRVAVITGGASGIGRALAEAALARGMHVVIADVERAALEKTAAELGAVGVVTDVTDLRQVEALAAATIARFGRVDLVANNAGVGGGGFVSDLTMKDWQWVLGVNLWGAIHVVQAFLPHLVANPEGAHLVNTASIAGLFGAPGIAPYCASKFALVGLSESLAREMEMSGTDVKVSVLCPGYVRTNIFDSQRNRPPELRNPNANADARARNDEIKAAVDALAISPSQVAEDVFSAVAEGRFWIFTHPEMMGVVEERHVAIAQATREAAGDGAGG